MTDENGNVVNEYTYDPWGNILSETETVENPIKYAGEYYDEELDMYYLRARYYDPNVGRFTSLDIKEGEISNPLDMNRYVYCRNNPIKYVDPSGEKVYIIGKQIALQLGLRIGSGEGIIIDEHYNVGELSQFSFGGGLDVGVSVGGYFAVIDTEYISDVSGGSFEIGGSASPIKVGPVTLGAGYDFTVGLGSKKIYGDIYSVNAGVSVLPLDGHAQLSYTTVKQNLYTLMATLLLKLLN